MSSKKIKHSFVWMQSQLSGKWQDTNRPGLNSPNSGTEISHLLSRYGQRGWKGHPEGISMGLGVSPLSTIIFLFARGSGIGTAANRASV